MKLTINRRHKEIEERGSDNIVRKRVRRMHNQIQEEIVSLKVAP